MKKQYYCNKTRKPYDCNVYLYIRKILCIAKKNNDDRIKLDKM